ncbi:MAG: hypothetical protein H6531_03080 [Actinobacteria bacterium]|nr:hypothetical protein [Actinomycetota bacterium]
MTVLEHLYDIPDDDELSRLIGAATPHFSLQIKHRIERLLETLPPAHERRAGLEAQLAHLESLANDGEAAGRVPNLPPRPSLAP